MTKDDLDALALELVINHRPFSGREMAAKYDVDVVDLFVACGLATAKIERGRKLAAGEKLEHKPLQEQVRDAAKALAEIEQIGKQLNPTNPQ